MAQLSNEEILDKAIEKARKKGYMHYGFFFLVHSRDIEQSLKWNEHYHVIFSREFAQAVGYKLADLGAWSDEGGDPLEFIAHFV